MSVQSTSNMIISKNKSRIHYRIFNNIFLYITERCQLRCNHCYMGKRLERGLTMTYKKSVDIMNYCRRLGAKYITFVGGEPTLHPELPRIVDYAISVGYEKIYIDTNGLLIQKLLNIPPEKIDFIRISLEGASQEIHEKVRGKGTYKKTIKSIKQLIKAGYRIAITCTIFQFNIHKALNFLSLADDLGIELVNYHVFSEEGRGIENSNWSLIPKDWIEFYESLEKIKDKYKCSIWYPPTWTSQEKIYKYVNEGYRGCLGCHFDRLSIFPDEVCYICSVLFDVPMNYGWITDKGFILNKNNNEFEMFTKAIFRASKPWLSGCPAEKILERHGKKKTPNNLISLCRCWKSQI